MHAPQRKPQTLVVQARDVGRNDVVIFDGHELVVQSVGLDKGALIKGSRKTAIPILIEFVGGEELRVHPATDVRVIRS